jgi:nitrate reductase NapAB chaperone NapD
MVICSYVVIAAPGSANTLKRQIAALPGCDVASAHNRDVLLVVTEAEDVRREAALRESIVAMEGVRTLAFTFGQVEPAIPPDPPASSGCGIAPTLGHDGSGK